MKPPKIPGLPIYVCTPCLAAEEQKLSGLRVPHAAVNVSPTKQTLPYLLVGRGPGVTHEVWASGPRKNGHGGQVAMVGGWHANPKSHEKRVSHSRVSVSINDAFVMAEELNKTMPSHHTY